MITIADCLSVIKQFLIDEGFTVSWCSSLTVVLKYGPWDYECVVLDIDVDVDANIGVHGPAGVRILRVPLSNPESFTLLVNAIRAVHSTILEYGIDKIRQHCWRDVRHILNQKPPVPMVHTNPCVELELPW